MKRYLHAIISLSIICACSHSAPEYTEAKNGPEQAEKMFANNLSNQNIYAFAEDKHGQIWIATFRGLNKYDGNVFTQYFCSSDNEGLFDNHITDVFKDSRDRLWVATVNGVCLYQDDDTFKRFDLLDQNRNVTKIFESSEGRIFMYSSTTLLRFDEKDEKIKPVIGSGYSPVLASYLAGIDNTLWGINGSSLTGYNADNLAVLGQYEAEGTILCSAIFEDGNIYLCTDRGFAVFNTISRQFKACSPVLNNTHIYKYNDVYACYAYGANRLMFFTRTNGSFIYDIGNDILKDQNDKTLPFDIPNIKNVTCVFRDSAHNLWIGQEDKGFHVIERNKDIFHNYHLLQDKLKGEQVISLATTPDKSMLFAETKVGGLVSYNCETDEVNRYPDITSNVICIDSKGNLWTSANNRGNAIRYSIQNGKLVQNGSFPVGYSNTIVEDHSGNIWFGCLGEYVARYSYETHTLDWIRAYNDNVFTFISTILPLTDTTIMVSGFMRNPVILDTRTGKQISTGLKESDLRACIRRSVMVPTCSYADSKGMVWIGTIANGLLQYDPAASTISPVPGTPCIDISSIEEDTRGNLWVSSLYGIGRMNSLSGEFANFYFDKKEGGNQFYERASCRLADGTIVFGGTHGITTVKAKEDTNTIALPFAFQEFRVLDKYIRPGEGSPIDKVLCDKPEIKLRHDQNSFSITYAVLDFAKSGSAHYYYKLEGYDKQWHDAGENPEAVYTRVGAGNYTFRVRYSDDSHNVRPVEDSLSITIDAAPWATRWAISGYILIISIIVLTIVHMRRKIKRANEEKRRLEYEKEQEKKLNKMHMSFFANVAHEFRTPLTTIMGPVSILSENDKFDKEDRKLISVLKKSADRMMSLVNQFLDFNKLENDTLKLEVSSKNIIDSIKTVVEVFVPSAKTKNITITAEGLDDDFEMFYDEDKVLKMLSNLLSNAVKYTEVGGSIKVGFYTANNGQDVKIFVADNGMGIAPELREKIFERYYRVPGSKAWGTGIGLYYVKSLARVHHGDILCEANEEAGKGSVFTITLPASASAYSEDEKRKDLTQSEQFPIEGKVEEKIENEETNEENKMKILVIDDDLDICNYLKMLLRSADYMVTTCYDADSGLAKVKEWEPDLAICDVSMPGKDGYEFCRTIRADLSLSHIPVILVTAKTDVSDQVKGLDSGADAYITKPFDPKYLFAAIKSQLERRHKVQETLNQNVDTEVIEAEESLSLQEKAFLAQLYKLMEDNIADYELDITDFANSLHISRTKLYYKVKGLTGESPAAFFKNYKLNKAAEMICNGQYNLSEISNMTGFASLSHFSTSFKKHFGMTPSEYAKNKK